MPETSPDQDIYFVRAEASGVNFDGDHASAAACLTIRLPLAPSEPRFLPEVERVVKKYFHDKGLTSLSSFAVTSLSRLS